MVKVRLFCWWCCVCCTVLLSLCIIILRARHDHNKTAPCGMIKGFLIELNTVQYVFLVVLLLPHCDRFECQRLEQLLLQPDTTGSTGCWYELYGRILLAVLGVGMNCTSPMEKQSGPYSVSQ